MKTKVICIVLIMSLTGISSLLSQGFHPPSQGKAVVYFVRTGAYGKSDNFLYFHNDKYIGEFSGIGYIRYECNPGQQLFWASSENKEFMTADLKEGGTYIVNVWVVVGFWKGHVQLSPLPPDNKDLFEKSKALINEKPPIIIPEEKPEKINNKMKKLISETLEKYDKEWKNFRNFKHLSTEMAIPPEAMK